MAILEVSRKNVWNETKNSVHWVFFWFCCIISLIDVQFLSCAFSYRTYEIYSLYCFFALTQFMIIIMCECYCFCGLSKPLWIKIVYFQTVIAVYVCSFATIVDNCIFESLLLGALLKRKIVFKVSSKILWYL